MQRRQEEDIPDVRRPALDVIGARSVGGLPRLTTVGGHHEDIEIAAVLGGEGDPFPVGSLSPACSFLYLEPQGWPQVQSTWFPLIDRNPQKYVPNIFAATDADYLKATQSIYRSKTSPSGIILPVLSTGSQ